MDWQVGVAVLATLAATWALLVAALYVVGRRQGEPTTLRQVLALVPDVVRLLRRLVADPEVPRGARIRLALLIGYLLLPIDLVPDFIPVVGYADDAVVVVLALRAVVRAAGPEALDRHWTGSAEGLALLRRLVFRST